MSVKEFNFKMEKPRSLDCEQSVFVHEILRATRKVENMQMRWERDCSQVPKKSQGITQFDFIMTLDFVLICCVSSRTQSESK